MNSKDLKLNIRRHLDQSKAAGKPRPKNKQNVLEYSRREKSRSGNKTCTTIPAATANTTTTTIPSCTKPKKPPNPNLTQQPQPTPTSYKLRPQPTTTQGYSQKQKFLTADVSSVLKVINKNMTNCSPKRRINMMTEEDIERLFDPPSKKKSKERASGATGGGFRRKANVLGDSRGQYQDKSKSREKRKQHVMFLHTDPDCLNYSGKMETVKFNIKELAETEGHTVRKDFAESIKFLQVMQDQHDKLLSALKDQGLIKIQSDPTVDKTSKFKQQFVVGKQIGEGAYASVRVAIYKPNNKKVAIKIYQKKKIRQIQRRKSVRRQIKILQKIDHQNILKIFDVIETNNHVNIIMEYVPGISLNAYLKSQPNSKVGERDARRIFMQLVEAIRYLHSLCICHRDIKLENILLDSKLSAKLIDFGFSTCIEQEKKVKMFCGTPSYMAPEIVVKKEYHGALADIWALGVLLYVILTGVFPFRGHTDKELYQKICNADYPRLTGVSKSVQNLVQAMLTIDPDRRITAQQIMKHQWIVNSPRTHRQLTPDSQLHRKFQQLLTKHNAKKPHQLSYHKQGLAQTYKQNFLKYQLQHLHDKQPSPRLTKPKTCTNRESHKINFQPLKTSSSKLLELLKMELRRKDDEGDRDSARVPREKTIPAAEERLTNKRYF